MISRPASLGVMVCRPDPLADAITLKRLMHRRAVKRPGGVSASVHAPRLAQTVRGVRHRILTSLGTVHCAAVLSAGHAPGGPEEWVGAEAVAEVDHRLCLAWGLLV